MTAQFSESLPRAEGGGGLTSSYRSSRTLLISRNRASRENLNPNSRSRTPTSSRAFTFCEAKSAAPSHRVSAAETFSTRRQPALSRGGQCYVYNDFLPAALAFAHRALAAADSLARAFALILLLTFLEVGLAFRFARPAFPVTPTPARTDILLLPRRVTAEVTEEETPKM